MSDMFDAMVSGIPNGISVKQLSKTEIISNPVLYNSGNPLMTFLVDEHLNTMQLEVLRNSIEKVGIHDYQVLYPLTIEISDTDKTPIYKKYSKYKFNLSEYIPKWSKIICFGKSLFSICMSMDLDCSKVVEEDSNTSDKNMEKNSIIQGFYDTILWKTSFFDPNTKCYIFPVDSWNDLISKKNYLFAETFEVWFMKKQFRLAKALEVKPLKLPKLNLVKVENPNDWLKERTLDKAEIAIDTETKGLDPFAKDGKLICVTISYDGNTGYFLRWKDIDPSILSEYLKGRPLILTNGKYDLKWLHIHGNIPLDNMHMIIDTIPLQQICNEMLRKGLKSGTWLWTTYGGYDKELDDYMDSHPELNMDYSLIPENTIFPYATTDACMTYKVSRELLKYRALLDEMFNKDNPYGYSLKYCYDEIIMPAINLFTDVETRGMCIDMKVLDDTSKELQKELIDMAQDIRNSLNKGKGFNVNSNDELGKALEDIGLPIVDRNSRNLPNVGESQLKAWSKEGYAIADKILKYREVSKNFSTFVGMEDSSQFGSFLNTDDSILDYMEDRISTKKIRSKKLGVYQYIHDDGRVHGTFALFSTQSLRSRSFSMNLQQIPAHGDKAEIARKPFRPPTAHHAFMSTDLSGVQLRIGAILSGDKNMRDTFVKYGGNMHLMTASSFIPYLVDGVNDFDTMQRIQKDKKDPLNETIKDWRFKAKAINFLCEFGGSASVLAEQSIIPDWSEESMDKYLSANKLKERYNDILEKALGGEFYFVKPSLPPHEKEIYSKAYVVAEDLVKKFFTKYEGLKRWEDDTQKKASEQGYIVTVHGCIRRLPYLLFQPDDINNSDVNVGKIHNLKNISLNTQAQNFESLWINRATVNAVREMKAKGIFAHLDANGNLHGGYVMGCIHDAEELITDMDDNIYKEQVKIFHKWFCKDYPECNGIPIECETNIAPTYMSGELWDCGTGVDPESVDSYVVPSKETA